MTITIAVRVYHPRDPDEYIDLAETTSYIITRTAWDVLYPFFDDLEVIRWRCAEQRDDDNIDFDECVEERERELYIEAAEALEEELATLFVVRRVEDRVYIFAPDGTVRVVIVDLYGGVDGGSIFTYAVVNSNVPLPATPATLRFLDELVTVKATYDYGVETVITIDGSGVRVHRREIHP